MSIVEKIKQLTWWTGKQPDNYDEVLIKLRDVLKILEDGIFIPHNITERASFMTVLKSAAAHKNLLVVEKQKLQELADLMKKRPCFYSFEYVDRLRKLRDWFEVFEKKFGEMEKEEK